MIRNPAPLDALFAFDHGDPNARWILHLGQSATLDDPGPFLVQDCPSFPSQLPEEQNKRTPLVFS